MFSFFMKMLFVTYFIDLIKNFRLKLKLGINTEKIIKHPQSTLHVVFYICN